YSSVPRSGFGRGPTDRRLCGAGHLGERFMALVLDTGVLYGALDESDPDHAACAALVEETPEQLLIPVLVLGELDYWVRKFASADAWLTFCQDIREGAYTIYQLDSQLLLAAAQVEARFADLGVGLVDAS